MKQMSLIEMDGFLKGKCIPRDLKVNETNAEYLVRKFGELESKLETALRECRSAGITIDNLEAKCAALVAESAVMLETIEAVRSVADNSSGIAGWHLNGDIATWEEILPEINDIETPATDAFLAEVRAQGVEMYADNLDNGADDAERGGFDYAVKFLRSEASSVRLFADQLRKGGKQ
ncbi:hypothetical protein WF013_000844 [Escherichia coli]|uniref:hypothetical protein n=1 Tax=Escherichia coli TaxID=562 RepID=UPI000BE24582|nr:hypothetical protein [Escherichia coli]EHP5767221.1 hypothetical protein [Shigella flexneri]EFD5218222.1 hypothetical protein [Escherichia coli]EGD8975615.1 hypothetical protein [Escherichia coli]EHV3939785.1 hypothetical protein [Shigella flexneri]EHW3231729.1 hypothetical protein [Escherichia coli]